MEAAGGRGLHSSTIQLNLSRFCHRIYSKYPLIPLNICQTPPKQSLNTPPAPQKVLTLSDNWTSVSPWVAAEMAGSSKGSTGNLSGMGGNGKKFKASKPGQDAAMDKIVDAELKQRLIAGGTLLEPTVRQGLTLVHFSAQPEPFLSHNKPKYPVKPPTHTLNNP